MSDPLSIAGSVVGITAAALQGIKFLLKDIENVRNASESIKNLRGDLKAVEIILETWANPDPDVEDMVKVAVKNCERACQEFRNKLKDWTRHSSSDKSSFRDRLRVGIFEASAIASLSTQLDSCKNTLNLAIGTSLVKSTGKTMRGDFLGLGGDLRKDSLKLMLMMDLSTLRDDQAYIIKTQRAEIRKEVCKWLGAVTTENDLENYRELRIGTTCEWIFQHPQFTDWCSTDTSCSKAKMLWLHAPPGFGKSVLCANIIEKLSAEPETLLAYFFCSSEHSEQRDSIAIVRSWVSQVVRYSDAALSLAYSRSEDKGRLASRNDIWDLFTAIIELDDWKYVFVADALDECHRSILEHKQSSGTSRDDFLKRLKIALQGKDCRVLIVNRDESDIRDHLGTEESNTKDLSIHELAVSPKDVRDDVLQFSIHVVEDKLSKKPQMVKEDIALAIADRSEGMFLWVRLQKDHLRGGKNPKQLHRVVNDTPVNLDHVYDRCWSEIRDYDRQRADAILYWVTFALRPLTVYELEEAVLILDGEAVDDLEVDELPDEVDEEFLNRDICGLCGSLLEIRAGDSNGEPGLKTVHLVHFTVREYLFSKLSRVGVSLSASDYHHNYLAASCIQYLQYNAVWDTSGSSESAFSCRPFRKYATNNWHRHVNRDACNFQEVIDMINSFFSPQNRYWSYWRDDFELSTQTDEVSEDQLKILPANQVYYASYLSLPETIKYLHGQGMGLDTVGGKYGTALQLSCAMEDTAVFNLLIELGADISITGGPYGCAIIAAATADDPYFCQRLLDMGASPLVQEKDGWSPLHMATKYGCTAVAEILLNKGADTSAASTIGEWQPLHIASGEGQIEVAQLLLDRGADLSACSQTGGQQPLHIASSVGHVEVAQLLLDRGADLSACTQTGGWQPLHIASREGHIEIVQLLLDRGADVNLPGENMATPLHLAVRYCQVEILKLLAKSGAKADIHDIFGRTPRDWSDILKIPDIN